MVALYQFEKDYILLKYKTTSVPEMAKQLKRGSASLYPYMKLKGYEPCKTIKPRSARHPFRVQNRKLENYHIARRSNINNDKF